jgi:four helix bundle protein
MKKSFRDLFVWQRSVELACTIIELADRLVEKRRFALADQLVRAALSISSNIAEGQGRATNRDRRHYLVQARGSAYELETQLEIVMRAKLADDLAEARKMTAQISNGLTKMIAYLHCETVRP